MKLLDILTSPWAISQDKLCEILNIYKTHFRGEKIDWKGIEARVGLSMRPEPEELYQVINGAAVIPVKGVLTKGFSFFSFLFGGSSMKSIGSAFTAAVDDPNVESIVLDVDSPGGTVDGTEELGELIYNLRGKKPVIAFSDGIMASAAYWIASAADKIYISGNTIEAGSIGVLATHVDYSKQDEMSGEKWTEITAGKYKRIASAHAPLTKEGAAYVREQIDYLYSVFIHTVARNRNVKPDDALSMADGKIFIGRQAIEAGLVDGAATLADLTHNVAGVATAINQAKKEVYLMKLTLTELQEKNPELYAEVFGKGKEEGLAAGIAQGREAALEEGRKLGAKAELARIFDVRAQIIPGHEALIESLEKDGKTTGPEAAVKVLAAEKSVRTQKLDAFKADGNLNVPAAPAPDKPAAVPAAPAAKDATEAGEQLDKIAKGIQAEKKCSYGNALNEALVKNPKLAEIYNQ